MRHTAPHGGPVAERNDLVTPRVIFGAARRPGARTRACRLRRQRKSSSSQTIIAGQVDSGQADIKLPPGWKMTKDGPVRTVAAAKGGATPGATTPTGDTVPLAKEDPTTKFFSALGIFQSCLKGLGVKFIGVPDGADPKNPANNPDYIQALSKCAAKSNIVQALQDQQAAQDALTPEEIETQNKGYLVWRDCMIERGWASPSRSPTPRADCSRSARAAAVPYRTSHRPRARTSCRAAT